MNSLRKYFAIASVIILSACVDRIQFDIDLPQSLPVSVSGHITNLPGPYKVYLNSSFDIESKSNPKLPVSAKHVNLLDELGNDEELVEVDSGVYQTSTTQGRIGGVYKIRIEFEDDRVYESIPDTLLAPGAIDSVYSEFTSIVNSSGATTYGFDVYVNSHGNGSNDSRYLWRMTGTFKAITHPEISLYPKGGCYPIPEGFGRCNYIPLCTGLRNIAPRGGGLDYERIAPCECCTCWYQLFNNSPILSDALFTDNQKYNRVSVYRIPLDQWIFMFKIHTEISQSTLTENTFHFFKSIRGQKEAVGSLFQPVTGKIPNTFIQLNGTTTPIAGIFYAAGVASKSKYITPADVPSQIPIPTVSFAPRGNQPGFGWVSCLDLLPNATNIKPDFWVD